MWIGDYGDCWRGEVYDGIGSLVYRFMCRWRCEIMMYEFPRWWRHQ